MLAYIIRRLLLMIPTLVGILLINFVVVNMALGGPIENLIASLRTSEIGQSDRAATGTQSTTIGTGTDSSRSRAAQGIDPELLKKLEKQLNLDKPVHIRFALMLQNYATFNLGDSFFKGRPVVSLIIEKMPVSVSLGLWTTLIIYLTCIPLGIAKAIRDGTRFDVWTSGLIIAGNAIPGFLFGLLLLLVFSTGNPFKLFPLRGLVSDNWSDLSTLGQIADYFWHITLPVLAMVISGFATLTLLTKNSFLEEINKQYVITARAKGLTRKRVLYGHVFRNAMLIVIAGFPGAFISILFTSSMLIEVLFSLDGLGLLGFEALTGRDYPVFFGTLYLFSLIALVVRLITDLTYVLVDPRIDFESRQV